MKKMENFGVQELNSNELKQTSGGFLGIALAIVGTAAAVYGTAMVAAYYTGYQNAHEDCGCDNK